MTNIWKHGHGGIKEHVVRPISRSTKKSRVNVSYFAVWPRPNGLFMVHFSRILTWNILCFYFQSLRALVIVDRLFFRDLFFFHTLHKSTIINFLDLCFPFRGNLQITVPARYFCSLCTNSFSGYFFVSDLEVRNGNLVAKSGIRK